MWILAALVVTTLAAKPTTVEEFLAQPVEEHVEQLTGQAFVDYINTHQSFYTAEYSPKKKNDEISANGLKVPSET
ncbi:hypothetical protein ANCCEY_13296 [Ancylostoma ceylanicum]|uniref:Uncharacterized protein n=1 Tax=Ancylostoma ceylanicum TaxID=53326 RepID=A0A0D6LJ08_9BILA|nr:hypothetical protein ANCCEY_13296 [Ancylostoma ceylanicum]